LLYQAGGGVSFDRFRKAYWLLTEPKTLERYASGAIGDIARGWARTFRDKLEKDRFIEHLKGAEAEVAHPRRLVLLRADLFDGFAAEPHLGAEGVLLFLVETVLVLGADFRRYTG
jgi:hypothetical protein